MKMTPVWRDEIYVLAVARRLSTATAQTTFTVRTNDQFHSTVRQLVAGPPPPQTAVDM